MIENFRDNWLHDFFVKHEATKKVPADIKTRLFRKLQMIDDSINENDLKIPPSNNFEKLKGNLSGWHSIRVNKQWRLIFIWESKSGKAKQVYLDNHDYK